MEKTNKWKISPQLLPIGYIILICIGYMEKSVFYNKFGINIAPYLNFQEYLFIFLPIGAALISVLFIISAYMAGIVGAKFVLFGSINSILFKSKTASKKINKFENGTPSKLKKIRRILAIVLLTILLILPFIGIFYYLITRDLSDRVYSLLSFSWAGILLLLAFYQIFKKEDIKNTLLLYSWLMAILIPIVWSQKIRKANEILNGKSDIKVSFKHDNILVTTNDTLMFIGQTKEYLFLRDLNDGGNLIYQKGDISKIKIADKTFANNTYSK